MKPGRFSSRQASIVFASTVFLVFLFLNARVIDPFQHQRTLEDLDEISTLDSQIDEQVIKLRYRLLNNYDGLVAAENDLKLRRDDLKKNKLFQQEDQRIRQAVRQWEQAMARKEVLIEQFKSHNAILNNSLSYFPRTIEEAVRLAPSGLKEDLQTLLRDVLMVHAGAGGGDAVASEIKRLEAASYPPELRRIMEHALQHATYILEYEKELDGLIPKITSGETHLLDENLTTTYEQSFDHALKIANYYRFLLFLSALWLLSYAIYSFFRLKENSRRLYADIIERMILEARNERLTKLYKALSEINQAIVRMDDETSLFPLVCRMSVDFGGMKMARIGRLNEDKGLIEPVANCGEPRHLDCLLISSSGGMAGECERTNAAFRENRNVITHRFESDEIEASRREWASRHGFGSGGVFPISRAGRPFAVLSVYHAYPDAFDDEMIGLLSEMSRDISFALDNFDRESERKRIEQDLRIAATAFETQEGIVITDRNSRILRVNRAFTNLTGYSAAEAIGRTPAILKSGRQDDVFYRNLWETLIRDKYWQGELWNRRKNGEAYPEWLTITAVTNEEGQVTHYVGAFSDISIRKAADDKIHQLAFHDPLTNLPNRSLLRERLLQAMASSARSQHRGALLFIDLDNFKTLNDTRGHDVGDLLLIEISKRLQNCVRDIDTVARLGGDEFIVMLEDLSEEDQQAAAVARDIGEKILAAINRPFDLQGSEYHGSSSIGISLFCGEGIGMYDLLKHADTAMYQAKSAGHNVLRFFDPDTQAQLEMRAALVDDLRQALPLGQLELYYQIQVDDQRAVGAEAFLRWRHPERGMILPMEFIPLAEETGLIVPIGAWILHMACEQLKTWQTDPQTRHLHLAINISARQFRQPDFVAQVLEVLKKTGLDPLDPGLELELTESLVLHDIDDSIKKMQLLRTAGIHFSLDDFGTGQSSLSYLKRLPLNQIKIDQSFVRDVATDPNDAVIIRTIIGMAENLGLNVMAEGVETEQQRDFLERNGCHTHQGYLFARPVPIEEFRDSLAQLQDWRRGRDSNPR